MSFEQLNDLYREQAGEWFTEFIEKEQLLTPQEVRSIQKHTGHCKALVVVTWAMQVSHRMMLSMMLGARAGPK